jgi:phosphoglycolate phosphatase-like HAD superfamily hydrolase
MKEKYVEIQLSGESALCRPSILPKLRAADAIIFDCDGVLIDTRQSYRKTIVQTVNFILTALTSIRPLPANTIREIAHILKKSGGFNNDWDVVYVILLFLFSNLPQKFQNEFTQLIKTEKVHRMNIHDRFEFVKTTLNSQPSSFVVTVTTLIDQLKRLALKADDSGIESIEAYLQDSPSNSMFTATKRFLSYPGATLQSIPATVFDEVFYGPFLFEKIHGHKRQFYDGIGNVENEKETVLVTATLLRELAQTLGKSNFGIVSGRDGSSARFSLGDTLDMFKKNAVIFLMDTNSFPAMSEEERIQFKKPNAYPLIAAARGLTPFQYALFVGDSAEDIIMVQRANTASSRFISVGVYSLSNFPEELVSYFISAKTDVIVSSIVQLPLLLKQIKEKS